MRAYLVQASLAALVGLAPSIAVAADATTAANNPAGTGYQVSLPPKLGSTSGEVQIGSTPDGRGANVQIIVRDLPSEGGPFSKLFLVLQSTSNASVDG